MRLRAAWIAAGAVLAAACTQEPEFDLPTVALTPRAESPSTSPAPAAGLDGAPGRIAVLDGLGALVTIDPDGSDPVVLAETVPGETLVQQPTWSPDGRRIAWVRVATGEGGIPTLVTAAADGTTPTETRTAVIPFYLSWDPTSSRIAYLGAASSTDIQLGVAEVAGAGDATALDTGTSYYLSWNPTGDELFVHVDTDRLDRLELGGAITAVDEPGMFNVPVWTADGRSLVYATAGEHRQRLVAHDVERDRAEALVRFDGGITFVVDRDARRVAFQVARGPGDVDPLSVLDRETGEVEAVAAEIVPAYFWSPDGSRLLYLIPEETPEGFLFRWGVWDGESSFTTPRFAPTDTFAREYLRFFEQYAQSMTLWAPDGSAFAYAGTNEAGETGVWIQPAVEGVDPVLLGAGVFASWSPT
jgi:TolB protein